MDPTPMKNLKTTLRSGISALALCGMASAGTDKTLVSWLALANTTQQGGSALTIQWGDRFDGIVFGETAAGKWMAGSENFSRIQRDQQANAVEQADSRTLVQMAIVYQGNRISICRNGERYAGYEADNIDLLSPKDNIAVFGLRHVGAATGQTFQGSIEEARIYDRALTLEELKTLGPNEPSEIKPWACWTFEKGRETDVSGRFPINTLSNGARIEGGRLVLDANGATLVAAAKAMPVNSDGSPRWRMICPRNPKLPPCRRPRRRIG